MRRNAWQRCREVEEQRPRAGTGTRGLGNTEIGLCAATCIWVITAKDRPYLWIDELVPGFLGRPHRISCINSGDGEKEMTQGIFWIVLPSQSSVTSKRHDSEATVPVSLEADI